MYAKLVSTTDVTGPVIKSIDELIIFLARISNQENQLNTATAPKLIRFLIDNHHWSPFEMAHMTVEIETSRAIAAQILRHRSFSFQEFSQRYASPDKFEKVELRLAGSTNRQSSTEDCDDNTLYDKVNRHLQASIRLYNELVYKGIAKESARMVLPLCTTTKLYMTGSIRSWIHYLQIRDEEHVQKEHQEIAKEIKEIFCGVCPWTSKAMGWINE